MTTTKKHPAVDPSAPFAERFEARVIRDTGTDCWLFDGPVNKTSGQRVRVTMGRTVPVARAAYALARGIDPTTMSDKLVPVYSCDNPRCVNPAHIWMLTPEQFAMTYARRLYERYWEKVHKRGDDECWGFEAFTNARGACAIKGEYPSMKYIMTYRVAYAYANGIDPMELDPDIDVLQTCGNPGCVNPKHIVLASTRGCTRRKVPPGCRKAQPRGRKEEVRPRTTCVAGSLPKLSEDEVRHIREWYEEEDSSVYEIAAKYHMPPTLVQSIATRELYHHIH